MEHILEYRALLADPVVQQWAVVLNSAFIVSLMAYRALRGAAAATARMFAAKAPAELSPLTAAIVANLDGAPEYKPETSDQQAYIATAFAAIFPPRFKMNNPLVLKGGPKGTDVFGRIESRAERQFITRKTQEVFKRLKLQHEANERLSLARELSGARACNCGALQSCAKCMIPNGGKKS